VRPPTAADFKNACADVFKDDDDETSEMGRQHENPMYGDTSDDNDSPGGTQGRGRGGNAHDLSPGSPRPRSGFTVNSGGAMAGRAGARARPGFNDGRPRPGILIPKGTRFSSPFRSPQFQTL